MDDFKVQLDGFEANASTTPLIIDAKASLVKAQVYLDESKIEEAVITLQAAERIVADIRQLLVQ